MENFNYESHIKKYGLKITKGFFPLDEADIMRKKIYSRWYKNQTGNN